MSYPDNILRRNPSSNVPAAPPDIYNMCNLAYYHPEIDSMAKIKSVMERYRGMNGYFLLRNSSTKLGSFTISVMHTTGLKHIKVEADASYFCLKDIRFSSIHELVRYYGLNPVPNTEGIKDVLLSHPIPFQQHSPRKTSVDEGIYLQQGSSPPELPVRPSTRDTRHPPTSPNSTPTVNGSGSPFERSQNNQATMKRPQPPIPQPSTGEYERIQSDQDHLLDFERLKHNLQLESQFVESDRCDCGLKMDEAELPRGWSLHICRDRENQGEIFFMSPEKSSHWNLPLSVLLELNPEHQDRIKNLILDFEAKTGRQAMANLSHRAEAIGGAAQSCEPVVDIKTEGYQTAIRTSLTNANNGAADKHPESEEASSRNVVSRSGSIYAKMDRKTILDNNTNSIKLV